MRILVLISIFNSIFLKDWTPEELVEYIKKTDNWNLIDP